MINYYKPFGTSLSSNLMPLTIFIALLTFSPQANAMTIDEAMATKPFDTPTLDWLHKNNVEIPPYTDEDGTIVPSAGIFPASSFNISKVEAEGENTITLYEIKEVPKYYDLQTGEELTTPSGAEDVDYKTVMTKEITPVYYNLTLKQTTFGEGSDSLTHTLTTTPLKDVVITAQYDGSTNTGNISYIIRDKDLTGNWIGNTSSSSYYYAGGAIFNNRGKIGNITGDFIGNYVSDYGSNGGAIYNTSTIGDITGDFIGNYVSDYGSSGGAIYNGGTIGDITGDFIGNYADYIGGAIDNSYGTIGDITGDFIGNYVSDYSSRGGAIANSYGTIGDITGDFTGNYAGRSGGAISSYGKIGDITGDFIGNYSNHSGGAIYNYEGTIGNITGDFIGNYADYSGGAIDNDGTIGNITGDFIGNYAGRSGGAIYNYNGTIGDIIGDFTGNYSNYSGGAIDNGGTIGNITGDFIDNYSNSGGAIDNDGTIGDITSDFIDNYSNSYGGAIDNSGTIGDITSDFIDNYSNSYGGAIDNSGTIGDITGDFIGNYVTSGYGGAIYNSRTIGDITGDFIDNYSNSYGGAIDNDGTIGDIIGDFTGNYSNYSGGAIYNTSTIGNITGDFIGNYANGGYGNGGAIDNGGTIGDITGNFIGNYATSSYGGAICNSGTIGDITGDFIGNYVTSGYGGAIYNSRTIGDITGDFTGNYSNYSGGAIDNGGTIGDITGDFTGNYSNYSGGAIDNGGTIGDITGDFIDNHAGNSGGAISIYGNINSITGTFTGNYSNYSGGAIHNTAVIENLSGTFTSNYTSTESTYDNNYGGGAISNWGTLTINNSDFINNYAKAENGEAFGGAIYTSNELNITAKDGYNSVIRGNHVEDINGKRSEAIYARVSTYVTYLNYNEITNQSILMKTYTPSIVLINANTNGKFTIDDAISGGILTEIINAPYWEKYEYYYDEETGIEHETFTYHYVDENGNEIDPPEPTTLVTTLHLTGDETGEINFNNHIKGFDITHDNVTTNVAEGTYLNNSNSLNLAGGTMNIAHMDLTPVHFRNLDLTAGTLNLNNIDVDVANATMGRLTADTYTVVADGKISVNGMNLTSDSEVAKVSILFADNPIKNNVISNISELPNEAHQIAYSPIYKYIVQYDIRDDGGYFSFIRPDLPQENPSDDFNPAVLGSSTAQAGANATIGQVMDNAFKHSDSFMNLPMDDREALITSARAGLPDDKAAEFGILDPETPFKGRVWAKPYASFEDLPLKNGPKVDSTTYGLLAGYDSQIKRFDNGWHRVWTTYVGYTGAKQEYDEVESTQNGGLFGGTLSLYKGHFFNATTVALGASVAENDTMYGSEDFTMLMAGIGNKAGYNFELASGKYIVQPNLFTSYTFIDTLDYTNAAGVKIDSKPLNVVQLTPGAKFIGNFKNGWQPYLNASATWNFFDESDVTADGEKLPEMSIKPYVSYGGGLQKKFKDKYLLFGQVMFHSGGREGVSLTAGFSASW